MISLIFALGFFTSSSLLFLSVKRNMEYMEKLDEIEESLQQSIEILEVQYQIIEKKTKVEVFSDEPLIRDLVRDISAAKNAVLHVTKLLDDSIIVNETEES